MVGGPPPSLQVLFSCDEFITDPILAAVGQLQYEVSVVRRPSQAGVLR